MPGLRLSDLQVYVIHSPELRERRARLEASLAEQGLVATWVEDPVAATLDPALERRYYRGSRLVWMRRTRSTRRIPFRRLSKREIAVTIAHVHTLKQIGQSKSDWALVLEDDAILADDFAVRFDTWLAEAPADADVIYIGSCSSLRIADTDPGKHFYRKDHPASKCSDSTLFHRRAAAALAPALVPFALTIDWELNHHFRTLDLNVYWLEPPLVSQGSESGVYPSSQR